MGRRDNFLERRILINKELIGKYRRNKGDNKVLLEFYRERRYICDIFVYFFILNRS